MIPLSHGRLKAPMPALGHRPDRHSGFAEDHPLHESAIPEINSSVILAADSGVGMPGGAPLIRILHLRIRFRVLSSGQLPDFPGDVWRSALGLHLRRNVCLTGAPACTGCPLRQDCSYGYVMETLPGTGSAMLAGDREAPHPYVLLPQEGGPSEPGALHHLNVILFGRGAAHAGSVILAAIAAGAAGIGATRQRLQLEEVQHLDETGTATSVDPRKYADLPTFDPVPTAAPSRALVELQTPLRLRVRDRELRPPTFTFRPFFASILRRATQLISVHGSTTPPDASQAAELMRIAGNIELHRAELRWREQRRWSSRQKREIPTGGLLGTFELRGELAPLWPWLWLGQWLHVGKGTVMGQGHYRLEACRSATTWLVTRHPGAETFLRNAGEVIDRCVTHLDPLLVEAGDTVIGTLPLHHAAAVCARGARFLHLALDVTADQRGKELDAQQLTRCGARLEEFRIERMERIERLPPS